MNHKNKRFIPRPSKTLRMKTGMISQTSLLNSKLKALIPEELMSVGYRFKTDMCAVFVCLYLQG